LWERARQDSLSQWKWYAMNATSLKMLSKG
jgi:hypothetical protein